MQDVIEHLIQVIKENRRKLVVISFKDRRWARNRVLEYRQKGPEPLRMEESLLRVKINELFLEVLRLLRKQNLKLDESLSSRRRSVELFLGSLGNHIDRPWTLDLMAEQCGLGRSRFSHYCYEITNMSPSEFLNFCRIERAREMMLRNAKASITEIAIECGFSSSQYFATVFRKHIRSSPLEFRKRFLERR